MFELTSLDKQITDFINLVIPHNGVLDYFFSFFSLQGNSFFLWVVIILLVLFFEERQYPGISKKDLKFVSLFLVSFFLTAFLSQVIIKNLVQRPRPCSDLNRFQAISTNFNCPTDYSFPSSHASTAFAASTVISIFDKRHRSLYFLVAILISLSRVYLGYHYFFDILGGATLGYLVSAFLQKIFKK